MEEGEKISFIITMGMVFFGGKGGSGFKRRGNGVHPRCLLAFVREGSETRRPSAEVPGALPVALLCGV